MGPSQKEFDERVAAEKSLRRTVARLCAAAMGRHAQLDARVLAVGDALRSNVAAPELEVVAAALTDTLKELHLGRTGQRPTGMSVALGNEPVLVSVHGVPPPRPADDAEPADVDWPATRAGLASLLRRLDTPGALSPSPYETLLSDIAAARTDPATAAVLERAGSIALERGRLLETERAATSTLLFQVNERLDDVVGFLAGGQQDRQSGLAAAQELNLGVLARVESATAAADAAPDWASARSAVNAQLQSIAEDVKAYGEREAQRVADYASRTAAITARMQDLEARARQLTTTLDAERRRARIDALTGVANRAAFDERLAEELRRQHQTGGALSLLLWDVDRFKSINDTHGHRVGDRALQEVARTLKDRLRHTDFVARVGGEEFAVLLAGTGGADAMIVANDLREIIAALRLHNRGTPVPVTASCGVTEITAADTLDHAGEIFERADHALYRAKNQGRNLCVAA